jgi:hypothetical protein
MASAALGPYAERTEECVRDDQRQPTIAIGWQSTDNAPVVKEVAE